MSDVSVRLRHCPASQKTRNVAVVVLNYEHASYSIACINSLLNLTTPASWIIVVDNGSRDDSVKVIREWIQGKNMMPLYELEAETPTKVKNIVSSFTPENSRRGMWLLCNSTNTGYAGGNNLGITLACCLGAEAVWLLNNDTEIAPDALRAMYDALFACSRPGLCGSLIVFHNEPCVVQCRGGGWTNKWTGLSRLDGYGLPKQLALALDPAVVSSRLNFIYGASVMVSRAFIEHIGLMDERYFMYCEEQDWAYRNAGTFDLTYAPDAIVYHHEGISTGWPASVKLERLLQMSSSRIRLTIKHFPIALPIVFCTIGYAAIRLLVRRFLLRYFR